VGSDVLPQLRTTDDPARLRGFGEFVDAVAAFKHRDDTAGAANGCDREQLFCHPFKVGRQQIETLVILFMNLTSRGSGRRGD